MKERKRPYVQTARLQLREQTRNRIIDALVELHQEVGPKNTTLAAVANRAGVQRLTVYRHFDDESAMLQACSGKWAMDNPPPDESEWGDIEVCSDRVYSALLAISKYYSRTEAMLEKVYRDASQVEALAPIMEGFDQYFTNIADKLSSDLSNGKANDTLRSVARHLTRFSTWQTLARENLSNEAIARAGLAWLECLAR